MRGGSDDKRMMRGEPNLRRCRQVFQRYMRGYIAPATRRIPSPVAEFRSMSSPSDGPQRKKYLYEGPQGTGTLGGTLILAPGALLPVIDVMAYGPGECVERRIDNPRELKELKDRYPVLWVNVDGLGSGQVIFEIGRLFDLHPLALEDVGHRHQRAKVEEFPQQTFIVARAVEYAERLDTQQVSFFLGANYVISFQERPRPRRVEPIRERIRRETTKLRASGADYLIYSLVDAVMDGYFPVLEKYAERLEELEDRIVKRYDEAIAAEIHDIKGELLIIRRALWPHREALNCLARNPNPLIHDETRVYLRDCYDHTLQLFELVETYRELASDLRDLFLSAASHRMNEIMKVLTIVSTTFIPLGFIAGLYGMNFNNEESPWSMPELKWYFGYPMAVGLMAAITCVMLFYFYRKGWIRPGIKKTPSSTSQEGN